METDHSLADSRGSGLALITDACFRVFSEGSITTLIWPILQREKLTELVEFELPPEEITDGENCTSWHGEASLDKIRIAGKMYFFNWSDFKIRIFAEIMQI
jgi:hypothetical protein